MRSHALGLAIGRDPGGHDHLLAQREAHVGAGHGWLGHTEDGPVGWNGLVGRVAWDRARLSPLRRGVGEDARLFLGALQELAPAWDG